MFYGCTRKNDGFSQSAEPSHRLPVKVNKSRAKASAITTAQSTATSSSKQRFTHCHPLNDPHTAKPRPLPPREPMRTALAEEGVESGRLSNRVRRCLGVWPSAARGGAGLVCRCQGCEVGAGPGWR